MGSTIRQRSDEEATSDEEEGSTKDRSMSEEILEKCENDAGVIYVFNNIVAHTGLEKRFVYNVPQHGNAKADDTVESSSNIPEHIIYGQ